jgi:hypothetical protein
MKSIFFKPGFCIIFIIALLFGAYKNCSSQSPDFSFIQNQFNKYRNNVLQEKLYAHTDKNFYLAGELIWFKLYNVDASFHQFLNLSKVAYVEILDKDHIPVIQTKIALADGVGNGSLILPLELNSGNYTFRVYTNWMKNFDADFYFEKNIIIVNAINNEPLKTKAAIGEYDIQFFPEGGNLVNGIESTLAFRVVDQSGKGVSASGVIINQNGDTIVKYQSEKFGIGSLSFLPIKNNKYKTITLLSNGNTISKDLPTAYEQGYVLGVKNSGNGKVNIRVQTSTDLNGQNIYLFIHSRQQIIEARNIVLTNNVAEYAIDENKLGEGISQITIFNAARLPVCERLIFKKPSDQLIITASSDKAQYESRKKMTIEIDTKDRKGNSEIANLSVSVYKLDSLPFYAEQDIFSYLWLSSDLKGNVESPGYYLNNTGEEVDKALDNLMLTHGWRRFKWEEILQNKNPSFSFIPEYEGPIVSGKVVHKKTQLPAKKVESYLAVPGTSFQFYSAQSNERGEVNFYTKNFYDHHEIFAQAGGKERLFKIDLKNPFSENYSSRVLPEFSLASTSGQVLQAKSVNAQVQNIYAGDKQNIFQGTTIDTSSFYVPTRIYLLDNYVRFPTMEEVLREYVSEITVSRQNNKLRLAAGRRDIAGNVYRYEPLTMVDGVPLFDDPDKIFEFDPLKVKQLDIINKKYFLGTSSFEGIINFRTYKGSPEGLALDPNATVVDYQGLQMQREFFAPVYESANEIKSRMPDFRNLLFWSPVIKTSVSGKHHVSFYTADLSGKYQVNIEGLSKKGLAGTKSFTIDVVNPLFVQK